MNWSELIGKKIIALRGLKTKAAYTNKTHTPFEYVLFEDNIIMTLSEQDYYDYHDCNKYARTIELSQNPDLWAMMFNKENGFDEPDNASI